MVGQQVGKYRVVSRLGRGGMGTVYKAVDGTLDREVAIKALNSDLTDPDTLKRFRAEAVTLARLNHPNIATLFELTEHDGQLLMVMEFVRGETFESLSQRLGPMPLARTLELSSQVLDALDHAHRAGIVHRDLKPANLMLTESGLTKVMDFGLARMAGTEHLTTDGFMVGTPAYMAPEQVLSQEVDCRVDIYAMGVVIFRLLTGQLPFKADSGVSMAHKQVHDQPTPVRVLRTELSPECEAVIDRALAKLPANRFQTAAEFKAALNGLERSAITPISIVEQRSDPEQPTVFLPTPALQRRPRRVPAAALVAALLVAGVPATAFVFWRARGGDPAGGSPAAGSAPGPAGAAQAGAAQAGAAQAGAAAAATPGNAAPPGAAAASRPPENAASVSARPSAGASAGPAKPAPSGAAPADSADPSPGGTSATPRSGDPRAQLRSSALATVTFAQLKLLVLDEQKPHDRDITLRLRGDGFDLLDGNTAVDSARYRDVVGLYQSHSREPRWTQPDGKAVPLAKIGGRFSFLKGTPDWITVRTKKAFIALHVPPAQLARIGHELEARTGEKIVRTR